MNIKIFLRDLESKLSVLNDDEIKKISNKYKDMLEKRIAKGKTESEAIESLGNIEDLANSILDDYKIKTDINFKKSNKKAKNNKGLNKFFAEFFNVVEDLANYISKQNFKTILKIIFEILTIVAFVAILDIPFILVREVILEFFNIFNDTINRVIGNTISVVIQLAYIIFALTLFISLFKKKFAGIRSK